MTERRSGTKTDRIVSELRDLIDSGEIPRGERLQQDQLAARFATSITPVREALKRLEAEGLLVTEPHRGVRVSSVDLEKAKGVYVSRRLIEPYAAQRAALRVSRRDLEQATRLVERMRDSTEDLNLVNREFHFLFYDKCGIPALTAMIDTLWRAYPWDILSVLTDRRETSVAEHRAVLDAISRNDPEAIAFTIGDNLRLSYVSLVRHLTGADGEDPFALGTD